MLISYRHLLDALEIAGAKELGDGLLDYVDDTGAFVFLPEPDFQGNLSTTHVLDDIAVWNPRLSVALRAEIARILNVPPEDL